MTHSPMISGDRHEESRVIDAARLNEETELFTEDDISRVLRALKSNNIDAILHETDRDRIVATRRDIDMVQERLEAVSQRLGEVLEENKQLREKMEEFVRKSTLGR